MPKKSKKPEYTKNDFEKDIVSRIKLDFLKKIQILDERYAVDRGKILKAMIESLLDTLSLDFNKKELKHAMNTPAIIIYRKTQPHPHPICFIFAEFHFKRALITNANNASKILKKLFLGALSIFVALDKNPENIKKKEFKDIDLLVHGSEFEQCWVKIYEFLSENVFVIKEN
ncbi:MAG: hypothetical protein Q6363_001540 [Candidatus Njordarchaeota archaeon]